MMHQKLIIFDMDGVVFEGKNFWLELHQLMGTEKQAWQLWNGLGKTDFYQLSNITARKLWKNQSSSCFARLINERKPTKDIELVFSYLQKNNMKSAIVSSGPYQLAERAQHLFGVDVIRANKLEIGLDGTFTGNIDIQVDNNNKREPSANIMKKLGAVPETTAMIGDTASDAMIAQIVSLSIAYDSEDEYLQSKCKYSLKAGEMNKVIHLLKLEKFSND